MRLKRLIGLTLALLLLVTGVVSAKEIIQGDQCSVEADKVITGNLFALCRTLTVSGRVEGNIIGAATTAVINQSATVTGSLYLLAGQLDVDGTIGKDLHFAGVALHVKENAVFEGDNSDLIGLTLSTTTAPQTTIPGSLINLGYQLDIQGTVNHEVYFWGSALNVSGNVDGDVHASVGDPESTGARQIETLLIPFAIDVKLTNPGLIIPQGGHIGGSLDYTGMKQGVIDGTVAGETHFTEASVGPVQLNLGEEQDAGRSLSLYLSQVVRDLTTLGAIGVLGLLLVPRLLQAPLGTVQQRPVSSLAIGMLSFLLSFPVVLIMVLLSLLIIFIVSLLRLDGVVVAGSIVLGMVDIGGTSIFYFVAIFVARVIVSLALGRLIVRTVVGDDGSQRIVYLGLFVGVTSLAFLGALPAVGWVFNAVALFVGLGAILSVLQTQMRTLREAAPAPARYARYGYGRPELPTTPEVARQYPPPMLDPSATAPGMDNLPEGFEWWDDDENTNT